MKPFRFSMQKLLELKEALEQAAEEELARGLYSLQVARAKLHKLNRKLDEQKTSLHDFRGREVKAHYLAVQHSFFERLQNQIHVQSRLTAENEDLVLRFREKLKTIMREKEQLQLLKEKERKAWLVKVRDLEQKAMDEAARSSYLRNMDDLTCTDE